MGRGQVSHLTQTEVLCCSQQPCFQETTTLTSCKNATFSSIGAFLSPFTFSCFPLYGSCPSQEEVNLTGSPQAVNLFSSHSPNSLTLPSEKVGSPDRLPQTANTYTFSTPDSCHVVGCFFFLALNVFRSHSRPSKHWNIMKSFVE